MSDEEKHEHDDKPKTIARAVEEAEKENAEEEEQRRPDMIRVSLGRFRLPESLLRTAPRGVQEMFDLLRPIVLKVDITLRDGSPLLEYTAMSDHFAPVVPGIDPPLYRVGVGGEPDEEAEVKEGEERPMKPVLKVTRLGYTKT